METSVNDKCKFSLLESVVNKLLPISLFSGSFISLLLSFFLYPIFGNDENLRLLISGAINSCITLIMFCYFVRIFIKSRDKIKILLVGIIPIVWILFSVDAIIKYDFSMDMLFQLAQFGVFGMQMYFTAIILVTENKFEKFIQYFDYYGMILIPFCVFYIIRYFVGEWTEQNPLNCFAGMTYMTLAFVFLPIIVVMLCQYYLFDIKKCKKIFHICTSILFWIVIVFSGTRSAIVCVFFFLIILFIFNLLLKINRSKSIAIISMLIVGIFVVCTYAVLPKSTGHEVRSSNFNYDAEIYNNEAKKNIEIYDEDSNVKKIHVQDFYFDYLVKNNQNKDKSIKELHTNKKDGHAILNFKSDYDKKQFESYEMYFGRNILFKLSLEESKKALILGNGSNYYQNKYDNYPHNSFLEMLCDFGIIGTLILVGTIIFILIKLIPIAIKNKQVCVVLLICLMWVPISCLSGTLYLNYNLVFSISFGIACILFKGRLKQ